MSIHQGQKRRLDCEEVQALLDAYWEGEWNTSSASLVEAHCKDCPRCAARYREEGELREILGVLAKESETIEVPVTIRETVMASVRRQPRQTALGRRRSAAWRRGGALGAGLIALVLLMTPLTILRWGMKANDSAPNDSNAPSYDAAPGDDAFDGADGEVIFPTGDDNSSAGDEKDNNDYEQTPDDGNRYENDENATPPSEDPKAPETTIYTLYRVGDGEIKGDSDDLLSFACGEWEGEGIWFYFDSTEGVLCVKLANVKWESDNWTKSKDQLIATTTKGDRIFIWREGDGLCLQIKP